jgi:hypothetical protein
MYECSQPVLIVRSEGLRVEKERAVGFGFAVAGYSRHKNGKLPDPVASVVMFHEVTK